jgi:hypothetical protein
VSKKVFRLNLRYGKQSLITSSEKHTNTPLLLFEKATSTLIKASNGDLRKAIMFLQSGAKLHAGEKIVASSINEMAGVCISDDVCGTLCDEHSLTFTTKFRLFHLKS